jgi:calcineurin-like phosphoesterase family protein
MNQVLVTNWNSIVSKGDLVYHLGDFAWKNHSRWLGALNGSVILVRGNHDKMNQDVLRNFKEVHTLLDTKVNGQPITLCHYALRSWNKSNHKSYHYYGHSHMRLREGGKLSLSTDVGVDGWGFRPVPWEVLDKKMKLRQQEEPSNATIRDAMTGLANSARRYAKDPGSLITAIRNETVFDFYESEAEVKKNREENLSIWPL